MGAQDESAIGAEGLRLVIVHPEPDAYPEVEGIPLKGGGATHVVGRAATAFAALRAAGDDCPDIVLIEVDQSEYDPFELAQNLTESGLHCCPILIGGAADPQKLRRALTCGAQEYLVRPIEESGAAEAFYDVVSRFRQRQLVLRPVETSASQRSQCEVIGLVSARGGMGKSILASNLAVAMAQETDQRVTLIDYGVGDLGVMLDQPPSRGLVELQPVYPEIDASMLAEMVVEHATGVSLYSAYTRVDYLDPPRLSLECLSAVIDLLRESEQFVLIDSLPWPPGSDLGLLSHLTKALVISTGWNLLELRDTRALLDAIQSYTQGERTQTQVLLNRADKRDLIRLSDIETTLHHQIFGEIPNNTKLVSDSINLGKPVVVGKPDSDVSAAVREVACKLLGLESAAQSGGRGRSLFRLG